MAQQIINVGATPNDGAGDPIRTAFIKSNNNFSQLYSRVQVTPPTSLVGEIGDEAGMYAYDSTYFYYCFANYDGSSIIWAQVTQVGNISTNQINSGNSNVIISGSGGNVVMGINGVTNAAVFTSTTANLVGNVVSGGYFIGDGSLLTGLPQTYANANVTAYAESGWGGNIVPSANATYNLGSATNQWKSLYVSNTTIYLGNVPIGITAGNVLTVNGNAVLTNGSNANISTSGNVTVGAILTDGYYFANGSPFVATSSYGNANVVANLAALASNPISTSGNVTAGNLGITGGSLTWANASIVQTSASDVSITGDGQVTVRSLDGTYQWTFDNAGNTTVPGNISPQSNVSYSLGDATHQWKDLYVSGNTIYFNNVPVSMDGNTLSVDGRPLYPGVEVGQPGSVVLDSPINANGPFPDVPVIIDQVTLQLADPTQAYLRWGHIPGIYTPTMSGGTSGNITNIVITNPGLYPLTDAVDWPVVNEDNMFALPAGTDISDYANIWAAYQVYVPPYGPLAANIASTTTTVASDGFIYLTGNTGLAPTAQGNGMVLTVNTGAGPLNWTLDSTGNLTLPGNTSSINYANGDPYGGSGVAGFPLANGTSNFDIATANGNVTVTASGTETWTFGDDGLLTLPGGNVQLGNQYGAQAILAINEPFGVVSQGNVGYTVIQWIDDIGNTNALSAISINGPGGNTGDITVTTGGIGANANVWTFDTTGTLTLPRGGIVYETNIPFGGLEGNTIALKPSGGTNADQQLLVYPTAGVDFNHLHLTTGNLYNTELFLGNDNLYVKLANTGNVIVNSNDDTGNTAQWTFGTNGIATLPGEGILQSINDTVTLSSLNTTTGNANSVYLGTSGGLGFNDQEIGGNWLEIFRNGAEPEIRVPVGLGNLNIQTAEGNTAYNWTFDNTGNLTVPGNISATGNITGANNISTGTITLINGAVIKDTAGNAVAFGLDAGQSSQGDGAVAIGDSAGNDSQGQYAVAIGIDAGSNTQGAFSVAIGVDAGKTTQGNNSVSIGTQAGNSSQGNDSVAIGYRAGQNTQSANAVAVGYAAGNTSQGNAAVAIGIGAGLTSQGNAAVAVGAGAGNNNQGLHGVAIGTSAGNASQSANAVAVGYAAGNTSQGNSAVAIGDSAGFAFQGANAVAIGRLAGNTNQANNSIIINATGANLDQATANTFTVAPVRNDVANVAQVMFYNTTSKEITYGNVISVSGNISGGNLSLSGNITSSIGFTGATITINNAPGGVEGAEIQWALPSPANTSLSGTFVQDVYANGMRFFESSGNTRGLYMDLGNAPNGSTTAVGYRDIPQVAFTANTTIATTDAGRHYYSTLSTGNVLTIANNASQGFQVGAAISIINQGTGNITVAQGSGVTLYLAGNATSGNRTVATFGMATLIKVATDTWFINGTGVT